MIPPNLPAIAILVDTATGWGRGIVRGVLSYADQNGPWDLALSPCGPTQEQLLSESWDGEGVIARIATQRLAEQLKHLNASVVNVSATEPGEGFPRVIVDNDAVVELAFQHFVDRGISSFAYLGVPGHQYSLVRQNAFARVCNKNGFDCLCYTPPGQDGQACSQREPLMGWVESLPPTCGVFTWAVESGVALINAAQAVKRKVPEDIAVLGSDDDELLCRAVRPSLSGIRFTAERIGYEAARLLDKFMQGEAPEDCDMLLKPSGITTRGSSDVLAVNNPDVAAAIKYIRENPDRPLRLAEVANAVTAAPRSLQRGFQQELRQSFSDVVAAARIDKAKRLLAETDLTIPKVSEACGFGTPEYMATVFRRSTGVTPRKFRMQARGAHDAS